MLRNREVKVNRIRFSRPSYHNIVSFKRDSILNPKLFHLFFERCTCSQAKSEYEVANLGDSLTQTYYSMGNLFFFFKVNSQFALKEFNVMSEEDIMNYLATLRGLFQGNAVIGQISHCLAEIGKVKSVRRFDKIKINVIAVWIEVRRANFQSVVLFLANEQKG